MIGSQTPDTVGLANEEVTYEAAPKDGSSSYVRVDQADIAHLVSFTRLRQSVACVVFVGICLIPASSGRSQVR